MQAKIITGVMMWTVCWTLTMPDKITPSSRQCNLNNMILNLSHHITSQIFGRRWGWTRSKPRHTDNAKAVAGSQSPHCARTTMSPRNDLDENPSQPALFI
ncbi:uncharacterized protein AKAW2_80012A [Aspergillus luchuensis]|uniref:Uncharacterized protein n=1 Tax=Aspergillus kawachii TaxID=1069201 RepID=A0A7R8A3F2_ASPKA|nr:uncharacterized protein AKAW2_80012A [Aspergillus luchuensis]BCS04211.1 hypothetical protein AKAW2_80012A [Aspergillus luchuensis]BCS15805.1 hypothetical protein ALUC_80012A [Aspergillus luchuensis]